jgi:hypothetical protein
MSFHRKAFLIWLTAMMLVAAAAYADAYLNPVGIKGGGIEQLIDAAQAHAKDLRKGDAADDEAERWERLAGAAREQLTRLLP